MSQITTQDERLGRLVELFKADSLEYAGLAVPGDTEGRRRLLRSMMNVRMPRPLPAEVLELQDEYLSERRRERGVVGLEDIPTIDVSLGSTYPHADIISLWQGDITRLRCGAIVNAANSQMLGCFQPCHDCIDNCIHSFAGVQLRAECGENMARLRRRYGPSYEQPTAVPMLTKAYNLPADKVIHVVGPIVDGALSARHERALLDCYKNVLDMCLENGIKSVAFCGISTGVFRFPRERAAQISVDTVERWLGAHDGTIERVVFTVFSDRSREVYEKILS